MFSKTAEKFIKISLFCSVFYFVVFVWPNKIKILNSVIWYHKYFNKNSTLLNNQNEVSQLPSPTDRVSFEAYKEEGGKKVR